MFLKEFKCLFLALIILLCAFSISSAETKMYISGSAKKINLVSNKLDASGYKVAVIRIITDMSAGFKFSANSGIEGIAENPGQIDVFLSNRNRRLKIMKSGYKPLVVILSEIGIKLTEGSSWQINLTSDRKQTVTILTKPEGVERVIDGKSFGTKESIKISFGKHKLTLKKIGYGTKTIDINIDETTIALKGDDYNLKEIEPVVLKVISPISTSVLITYVVPSSAI